MIFYTWLLVVIGRTVNYLFESRMNELWSGQELNAAAESIGSLRYLVNRSKQSGMKRALPFASFGDG